MFGKVLTFGLAGSGTLPCIALDYPTARTNIDNMLYLDYGKVLYDRMNRKYLSIVNNGVMPASCSLDILGAEGSEQWYRFIMTKSNNIQIDFKARDRGVFGGDFIDSLGPLDSVDASNWGFAVGSKTPRAKKLVNDVTESIDDTEKPVDFKSCSLLLQPGERIDIFIEYAPQLTTISTLVASSTTIPNISAVPTPASPTSGTSFAEGAATPGMNKTFVDDLTRNHDAIVKVSVTGNDYATYVVQLKGTAYACDAVIDTIFKSADEESEEDEQEQLNKLSGI